MTRLLCLARELLALLRFLRESHRDYRNWFNLLHAQCPFVHSSFDNRKSTQKSLASLRNQPCNFEKKGAHFESQRYDVTLTDIWVNSCHSPFVPKNESCDSTYFIEDSRGSNVFADLRLFSNYIVDRITLFVFASAVINHALFFVTSYMYVELYFVMLEFCKFGNFI